MMGDSPKYGGWMNVLVMVGDRPWDGGWPVTVIRIGDDCYGDMNTYGWGFSYLKFGTDRQTDTTMYRVVLQLKMIKEAGAGPSSSLLRVWLTDSI